MKVKILSIIELFLILFFLFSAFEIINYKALQRDMVSIGYTRLQINKNSTTVDYAKIDKTDKELKTKIRFFILSTIITGLLIIIVPLISLFFPSIRKFIGLN
jgi:hypothetical protein